MTKKWSRKEAKTVGEWLTENGAVESIKYDEDTGVPHRVFTIDLNGDGWNRPKTDTPQARGKPTSPK